MLIAKVNGERCHATKGAKGICPFCGAEVIAKCGEQKAAHWAHKSKKECDSWHESETDWHRMWKNYFSKEWQEIIKHDEQTGEKHIADVCTPQGFTLEFQHSHIKPEERRLREAFYKNMNWVVDGTRLQNDFKRFNKKIFDTSYAKEKWPITIQHPEKGQIKIGSILEVHYKDEIFPKDWTNSNVPVVFDFKGTVENLDNKDIRHWVFCLLPIHEGAFPGYVICVSKQTFIENAKTGSWEKFVKQNYDTIMQNVKQCKQERESYIRSGLSISQYYPRRKRNRWL